MTPYRMIETLKLDLPAFRIGREEVIDPVLFIGLRWSRGSLPQDFIHPVDILPAPEKEAENAVVLDGFAPAEAKQQVAVATDNTVLLFQPECTADLPKIELPQAIQLLSPEKADTTHLPLLPPIA
jgi:hypothetical protein